ncbi:MAG: sigma-70 family RNA polymerase sigma factor [Bacteroidales bacterium]|nr:sigma-70 family RNA polymerase sigma factor [Bacteroidales bacterium]
MFGRHSDKKLIEGIRRGDDYTLNYLYNNYFDLIRNHIIKNSGTEDDAYDIFQDAMVALFKKVSENHIELTTDLKGYLFIIARNMWSIQLRRVRRISQKEVDVADEDDISSLLDTPIEQIVQRSFLKLDPECRKVLELHMEGHDYDHIARVMNYKSEGYARRKKYLSKETLLKIIRKDPDYEAFTDLNLK